MEKGLSLPSSIRPRSAPLTLACSLPSTSAGWNKEEKFFGQSYEGLDVLDSAVLISSCHPLHLLCSG